MSTALKLHVGRAQFDWVSQRRGRVPPPAETMQRSADRGGDSPLSRVTATPVQAEAAALLPLQKMVHEIRDPITLILLTAERTLRDTQDGNIIGALKLISEEIRRAERIMQGALERAVGESAVKPIGELNTVVRRAMEKAQRYCDECAPGRLAWELDLIEPSPEVRMNAAAIEQVIVNLIKNAVEASHGGPYVVVGTANTPELAEVVIADNCGGIPAEFLPRIFEPFVSTKSATTGRGLGLSICNEIVTDHGGEILMGTEVGRGSKFTIRLPRANTACGSQ